MRLRPPIRFETPKVGNWPDEMENDSRISHPFNGGSARISLGGASESAFTKQWAQFLTRAFVYRPLDLAEMNEESIANWLAPAKGNRTRQSVGTHTLLVRRGQGPYQRPGGAVGNDRRSKMQPFRGLDVAGRRRRRLLPVRRPR